jgi:hypothetical protein
MKIPFFAFLYKIMGNPQNRRANRPAANLDHAITISANA